MPFDYSPTPERLHRQNRAFNDDISICGVIVTEDSFRKLLSARQSG